MTTNAGKTTDGQVALRHLVPNGNFQRVMGDRKVSWGGAGTEESVQIVDAKIAEQLLGMTACIVDHSNGHRATIKRFERVVAE